MSISEHSTSVHSTTAGSTTAQRMRAAVNGFTASMNDAVSEFNQNLKHQSSVLRLGMLSDSITILSYERVSMHLNVLQKAKEAVEDLDQAKNSMIELLEEQRTRIFTNVQVYLTECVSPTDMQTIQSAHTATLAFLPFQPIIKQRQTQLDNNSEHDNDINGINSEDQSEQMPQRETKLLDDRMVQNAAQLVGVLHDPRLQINGNDNDNNNDNDDNEYENEKDKNKDNDNENENELPQNDLDRETTFMHNNSLPSAPQQLRAATHNSGGIRRSTRLSDDSPSSLAHHRSPAAAARINKRRAAQVGLEEATYEDENASPSPIKRRKDDRQSNHEQRQQQQQHEEDGAVLQPQQVEPHTAVHSAPQSPSPKNDEKQFNILLDSLSEDKCAQLLSMLSLFTQVTINAASVDRMECLIPFCDFNGKTAPGGGNCFQMNQIAYQMSCKCIDKAFHKTCLMQMLLKSQNGVFKCPICKEAAPDIVLKGEDKNEKNDDEAMDMDAAEPPQPITELRYPVHQVLECRLKRTAHVISAANCEYLVQWHGLTAAEAEWVMYTDMDISLAKDAFKRLYETRAKPGLMSPKEAQYFRNIRQLLHSSSVQWIDADAQELAVGMAFQYKTEADARALLANEAQTTRFLTACKSNGIFSGQGVSLRLRALHGYVCNARYTTLTDREKKESNTENHRQLAAIWQEFPFLVNVQGLTWKSGKNCLLPILKHLYHWLSAGTCARDLGEHTRVQWKPIDDAMIQEDPSWKPLPEAMRNRLKYGR